MQLSLSLSLSLSLRLRNKHADFIMDSKKSKFPAENSNSLGRKTNQEKRKKENKQSKPSHRRLRISFSTISFARIITFTSIIRTRRPSENRWRQNRRGLHPPPPPPPPPPRETARRYCISISRVLLPFKIAAIRLQRLAICRGSPPDWILPFTNYASSDRREQRFMLARTQTPAPFGHCSKRQSYRANTEIVSLSRVTFFEKNWKSRTFFLSKTPITET